MRDHNIMHYILDIFNDSMDFQIRLKHILSVLIR